MKTKAIAAVAAVGLLCGSAFAAEMSGAQAKVLQEMQDRAEIEALMWKYVRALDSMDAEAYASVYTEDGQFGSAANAEQGRDAMRKMINDLKKGRAEREAKGEPATPPMYHTIFNHSIEFKDKDHANYYSYWATMFAPAKQGEAPRVAAVGRGIDQLVRVNGQWLIKSRDVAPRD